MSLRTDTFIDKLSGGLHWAGVYVGIPALIVILCLDVLLRYIFNSPLIWGSEVSALILSVIFFASLPQITGIQGHIRMDMLYRLMTPGMKNFTDIMSGLCGIVFALLLVYQSFKSSVEMYRWKEGAEMIDIPYWPFVLFAGICGLILTSQFFLQMIKPFLKSSLEVNK